MGKNDIQIPFGAQDSELKGWEYTIPEGMEAIIKDGKVIVREKSGSEDERIYNLICSSIKNEVPIACSRNKKLALAYLEKQKEQNSSALQDAFEHSIKDYSLEEKSKAVDYADSILPTSVTCGESEEEYKLHKIIEAAFIAGQKEQKPKSSDSIPSDCTSEAKREDIWHKVTDSLPDSAREVLCKDAIGNFFIGRYYKSSQNWEVMMYDDCDKSNEDNPPVVSWCDIPSERQKDSKVVKFDHDREQKPVEWSDKDKAMLKVAIAVLRRYGHDDVADWLKSLRPQPHWKPSKEQMEALERASTNEYLSARQYDILVSLYEQLTTL